MKKTIVVFIGGYLPGKKYGGPVTSIENFVNQLCNEYNMKIICNNHDLNEKEKYRNIKDGWNKIGNADVYYIKEKDYTAKKFEKIIAPFKDDIIMFYLSGIYYIKMNYNAIKLSKKLNIPVVLAPRGDLMKNTISMKSRIKKIKKLVFLKLCKRFSIFKGIYFQATSEEERDGLYNYLNINKNMIFLIPNLPTIKKDRNDYVKEKNKLKILFISRLMIKKNPLYALNVVDKISDEFNVEFDIYGPKEDLEYWNKCLKKIDDINEKHSNMRVSYNGGLDSTEAKRVYKNYDCLLFPTVSENYGHVIVESMFFDCPVILSAMTTPWDDYDHNGGYVIPLDKPEVFTKTLENMAKMSNEEYKKNIELNRKYVDKKFNIDKLLKEYKNMINKISK